MSSRYSRDSFPMSSCVGSRVIIISRIRARPIVYSNTYTYFHIFAEMFTEFCPCFHFPFSYHSFQTDPQAGTVGNPRCLREVVTSCRHLISAEKGSLRYFANSRRKKGKVGSLKEDPPPRRSVSARNIQARCS